MNNPISNSDHTTCTSAFGATPLQQLSSEQIENVSGGYFSVTGGCTGPVLVGPRFFQPNYRKDIPVRMTQ